MKLPEKIKGRNRIRDGAIVLYFKRDNLDYPQLAEKFKLSERHIVRILAKNHAFVRVDKEWEKAKRLNRLHRWLKKDGVLRDSSKDPVDIQEQIRKEIEGDGANTSNQPIIQIINYARENNSSSPEVSRRDDRVPEADIARF